MTEEPLFSIITPCLNRAHFLGEAIGSVLAQGHPSFEHIIIDGASTDGTAALLASHPHLRVVSEPDRGLYDAINKGLRLARGKYIGFLNSDDVYAPGVFAIVAEASRLFSDHDVVSGGAEVFADKGCVLREVRTHDLVELHLRNVLAGIPLLNSRFFARTFVEKLGAFDLEYRVASDREWMLRACLANPREIVLPDLFYRYRQHDGSLTFHDTDRNVLGYREEHAAMAEKHLASSTLTDDARSWLRTFHMRESTSVAALHLRAGRIAVTRSWAGRGVAQNSAWPFAFAKRLLGQALGR